MGFTSWMDKKTNKLSAFDVAFVKISAMIFGLIIGAYIPLFVRQYVVAFIALFILASTKPLYAAFKK